MAPLWGHFVLPPIMIAQFSRFAFGQVNESIYAGKTRFNGCSSKTLLFCSWLPQDCIDLNLVSGITTM
jgi:hypothetical protein